MKAITGLEAGMNVWCRWLMSGGGWVCFRREAGVVYANHVAPRREALHALRFCTNGAKTLGLTEEMAASRWKLQGRRANGGSWGGGWGEGVGQRIAGRWLIKFWADGTDGSGGKAGEGRGWKLG